MLNVGETNEDFREPTEKRSGLLDEHDFSPTLRATLAVGPGAFYRQRYAVISADPRWLVSGVYQRPESTNGVRIDGAGVWTAVDGMERTFTTGKEVLYLLARVQWIAFGMNAWSWAGSLNGHARLQFALEVDGKVLPWTITGQMDPFRRPPWAIRPLVHRATGGLQLPGSHQPRTQTCGALNKDMGSEKLSTLYPVEAGTHVVRVVARRVHDREAIPVVLGSGDSGVFVFNRAMFIQALPLIPAETPPLAAVDIPALEPESAFSQASIQVNRVDALRQAYNTIPAGALARGAFNRDHLPSTLLAFDHVWIEPGTPQSTNNYYPGFGSATIAGSPTGTTGWTLVTDGAGGQMTTAGVRPGGYGTTVTSTLLVQANVQLRSIHRLGSPHDIHIFGMFTFLISRGGVVTAVSGAEAAANHWLNWGYRGGSPEPYNTEEDVPLMAALSLPAGSPAVDWVGLYVSGYDDAPGRADVTWSRANMSVLQFYGASDTL